MKIVFRKNNGAFMNKNIILCLSILFLSVHAAQVPEEIAWNTMTLQQKIDYLVNELREDRQLLEDLRQPLSNKKIWVIDRGNDSIELHCHRISPNPTYTIANISAITDEAQFENELSNAKDACFLALGSSNPQQSAINDLIEEYLTTYMDVIRNKALLKVLRAQFARYTKPAFNRPT